MAELFNRAWDETPNNTAVHHSRAETLEVNVPYSVHQFTLQGNYDELRALIDSNPVGSMAYGDTFIANSEGVTTSDNIIYSANLVRKNGKRGEATFVVRSFPRVFMAGLDFETVTKDIHFWRAGETQDKPDLAIIRQWEVMKDEPMTLPLFYAFKYQDSTGAEKEIPKDTATYALAEMIMRGVESYNEYVPVLTITYTFAKNPTLLGIGNSSGGGANDALNMLGRVVKTSEITLAGFVPLGADTGAADMVSQFSSLPQVKEILCTGSQMQGNSDGSFTLTQTFAGFVYIEKELYAGAGGKYGPWQGANEGQS